MKTNLHTMQARMNTTDETEARRKAIITSCLMTGALGLARIARMRSSPARYSIP